MNENRRKLLDRALEAGCKARLITQKRGGYRKPSSLGSTYSPERVIVIDGHSMGFGRARQYLKACEEIGRDRAAAAIDTSYSPFI